LSEILSKIKEHLDAISSARLELEDLISQRVDELEAQIDEEVEEAIEDIANKIGDARNAGDACDTIDSELDDLYSFLGVSRA